MLKTSSSKIYLITQGHMGVPESNTRPKCTKVAFSLRYNSNRVSSSIGNVRTDNHGLNNHVATPEQKISL